MKTNFLGKKENENRPDETILLNIACVRVFHFGKQNCKEIDKNLKHIGTNFLKSMLC